MAWLGLDIGSSFIKGAVLDGERRALTVVTRAAFPDRIAGLPPGHFEIDPAAVVAATRRVLDELYAREPRARGLLVCGQMGGVILVDDRNRPLTNYLSWRDERAGQSAARGKPSYLSALRGLLTEEEFRELGNELQAGSPLTLLGWLAARGQLPRLATPLSIGDFVAAQLAGSPPRMHPTQALGTLNLEALDWHYRVFEKAGLAALVWPPLEEFSAPIGTLALPDHRMPVFPVIGDHQAALAGSGLVEGELSINISTGSQVSLLTPALELGNFQTRPYINNQFLNTITHLPAGRALEVLVGFLAAGNGQPAALESVWAHLLREAETGADSELAVQLTFFPGPLGSRGSIDNISVDNLTPGAVFRAALRSMAENYEQCAARLAPAHDWSRLVFSGGLAQKLPLLRTMISARLTGPTRLSVEPEDTLLGLLALALVLEGAAPDVAGASKLWRADG